MIAASRLNSPGAFSSALYEIMKHLNPGIADLDLNEFRYALENLLPEDGWDSVAIGEPRRQSSD